MTEKTCHGVKARTQGRKEGKDLSQKASAGESHESLGRKGSFFLESKKGRKKKIYAWGGGRSVQSELNRRMNPRAKHGRGPSTGTGQWTKWESGNKQRNSHKQPTTRLDSLKKKRCRLVHRPQTKTSQGAKTWGHRVEVRTSRLLLTGSLRRDANSGRGDWGRPLAWEINVKRAPRGTSYHRNHQQEK